jgi:hypothetical protein
MITFFTFMASEYFPVNQGLSSLKHDSDGTAYREFYSNTEFFMVIKVLKNSSGRLSISELLKPSNLILSLDNKPIQSNSDFSGSLTLINFQLPEFDKPIFVKLAFKSVVDSEGSSKKEIAGKFYKLEFTK